MILLRDTITIYISRQFDKIATQVNKYKQTFCLFWHVVFYQGQSEINKKPSCWIFRYNFAELFREIKKSIWPSGLNCGRVLVTLSKQIILLAKKLFYKHEEINNFLKAEKLHFNVVKCFLYHICCSSFNNIIISRS